MRPKQIWQWVGENKEQLKILLTVFTIAFVYFQYSAAREEFKESAAAEVKRVKAEQALSHIERFQGGDVLKAHMALDAFWRSKDGHALIAQAEEVDFDDSSVTTQIRNHDLEADVHILQGFYRNVALCVIDDVCNAETVCVFFFRHMSAFGNTYQHYLKEWSQEWQENVFLETALVLDHVCPMVMAVHESKIEEFESANDR